MGSPRGNHPFWNHDDEADPDKREAPAYRIVHLIAESLDASFASLYEAPPSNP